VSSKRGARLAAGAQIDWRPRAGVVEEQRTREKKGPSLQEVGLVVALGGT